MDYQMKKQLNTLSIIIPNYNKGKYIKHTFDSILTQTRLPNEIIVVDDCSTDDSRVIISNYAYKYPTLIKSIFLNQNCGVQNARNTGGTNAISDFICFIDSDDVYLRNDAIEKQMKRVKNNRLVGVYQLIINDNGEILTKKARFKDKKSFIRHNLVHFYRVEKYNLCPSHYIIPKEAFIKVGKFDFPYNLYEDSDFLLKLMFYGLKLKIINIEGKGYRCNFNDKSHLSNADLELHKKAIQYLHDKHKMEYLQKITLKDKLYLKREMIMVKLKKRIKRFIKKNH